MSAATTLPANPADSVMRYRKPLLFGAVLLLFLQVITLLPCRWVEDESWYANAAFSLAEQGELRMTIFPDSGVMSKVDARPPLAAMFMAATFKLFGVSLYSAKLPFLLAGLLTVFLTYLLGCELGRPAVGLLAAFVLATDNLFFLASRTSRPEPLAAAFCVLSVLIYLRSQRGKSIPLAFLAGLIAGAGTLTHTNGFAAALAVGTLALFEFRVSILWQKRAWAFAFGALLPLLAFAAWGFQDEVHRAEFVSLYTHGEGFHFSDIPRIEWGRYADFLGFSSSRFQLTVSIPWRLHLALALLASAAVLRRYDRELLKNLLCMIVPAMLWWAYERNPTMRYIATGAPYLALLMAGGLYTLWLNQAKWRKWVATAGVLIILSQLAGNCLVLYLYRKADYQQVTRELRRIIPSGEPVYGAITFWLGLYDHPFYSWNRTPLDYAIRHGATHLILKDRVLVGGSGFGKDDWKDRREEIDAFVAEHAELVGRVPNPFYGDLEVYRVRSAATRSFQ